MPATQPAFPFNPRTLVLLVVLFLLISAAAIATDALSPRPRAAPPTLPAASQSL